MNRIDKILQIADTYEQGLPEFPGAISVAPQEIARYLDHTLLKPEATSGQVEMICNEALQYQCASVCVNSIHAPLVSRILSGSHVKTCAVIGFPLGATPVRSKVYEAGLALEAGAQELDMVIAIGLLKGGEYQAVFDDIAQVTEITHRAGAILKLIIETCLLTTSEKIISCLIGKDAGVDFVKTSTGFSTSGANVEDVNLMRRVVGSPNEVGVKAAGGVRSLKDALAMFEAGATRIGTSNSVRIMQEVVVINE
jgi:deoxyribose-phosphate aldolase